MRDKLNDVWKRMVEDINSETMFARQNLAKQSYKAGYDVGIAYVTQNRDAMEAEMAEMREKYGDEFDSMMNDWFNEKSLDVMRMFDPSVDNEHLPLVVELRGMSVVDIVRDILERAKDLGKVEYNSAVSSMVIGVNKALKNEFDVDLSNFLDGDEVSDFQLH